MIWQLELIIYLLLIASAIVALRVKDLLAAIVVLSVYSFGSAFLFAILGAVDVGFTEAVVGAGITGILFLAALYYTTRKTID
jgi:multicomponent Na+:H+ antiporter subunit B